MTLPPLAVHSLAVAASVQPMPLQEFCPLQDDDAVLQELVPLQELMPLHFTLSPAPAVDAPAPIANKTAAEATRRARLVMGNSLASAQYREHDSGSAQPEVSAWRWRVIFRSPRREASKTGGEGATVLLRSRRA